MSDVIEHADLDLLAERRCNPSHFNPWLLKTAEDCAEAQTLIMGKIAAIEQQLDAIDDPSPGWRAAARRALREWKARVQEVQSRRGELRRESKEKAQIQIERRFMNAALTILPRETVQEIWDEARRMEAVERARNLDTNQDN